MKLDFDGDSIGRTDYYSSHDCEQQRPWCYIHSSTWHILLPKPPPRQIHIIRAYPVTARSEPDGWRWRLEIGTWCLPLYHRCIRPFRPGFPARGVVFDRAAILYTAYRPASGGTSFFGCISPGWQRTEHPLKLVRR